MKVIINRCHGGFGLSHEAMLLYAKLKGIDLKWTKDSICYKYSITDNGVDDIFYPYHEEFRSDEALVQVVETLGERASGEFSKLVVVEIPDDVQWEISDYEGFETIHEIHRTWY